MKKFQNEADNVTWFDYYCVDRIFFFSHLRITGSLGRFGKKTLIWVLGLRPNLLLESHYIITEKSIFAQVFKTF